MSAHGHRNRKIERPSDWFSLHSVNVACTVWLRKRGLASEQWIRNFNDQPKAMQRLEVESEGGK